MSKGCRLRARVKTNGRINFTSSFIKTATKHLESLQRQLFKARSEGRLRKPIRFGMLLKNSYFNKLISLWKVAHVNSGKKTAGVDQMKIKLTDQRQISKVMDKLGRDLNHEKWKPMPVRRVMIPKPDGTERPLGIPTQSDRVVQGILNSILEVTVEHEIYHNQLGSYGFRKYHSTADAVSNLAVYARQGKQAIIIEADISKCFDRITHSYINTLLQGNVISKSVERLLMAGHLDVDGLLVTSNEGTPQGGVISPTISNLVLREILDKSLILTPKKHFGKNIASISLTTYADDLVIVIKPSNAGKINQADWQTQVSEKMLVWLRQQLSIAGLELQESKTRIITDSSPFDFLGYEIQRGKSIRLKEGMVRNSERILNQNCEEVEGNKGS